MQDLKIAFIQSDLYWQNPAANRAMFEEKIWQIKEQVDLIILPEMFTTGFTMDASGNAEVMGTTTLRWMRQMASQTGAAITGSIIAKEGNQYFNRLIWMTPDGESTHYDKRHLFRMAGENKSYSGGNKKIYVELKGWKILPLICYDLRFPVWSRNSFKNGAAAFDLMLYIASWPDKRINAWDALLKARAIENIAFCIGVNRTGQDGNNVNYCGHSAAYDFMGKELHAPVKDEEIAILKLDNEPLQEFRERFPFFLDSDKFEIEV